MVQAKANRQ